MLFNSIDFAIFLPLVFIFYWSLKNRGAQNVLLIIASYVFYGWWDWRFLSLIIISSTLDYLVGLAMSRNLKNSHRKGLLITSITVNLGFLGVFKYYNFFLDSFVNAFSLMGYIINAQGLDIILPIGISFYTFQTLSYSIDVYKRRLEPTTDLLSFFSFVSFFPQLVAGPIERAANLLPQFHRERCFSSDRAVDGLRQVLWGFFKKIAIADNCAVYVNETFANYNNASGSELFIGALMFSFQIYGDFSGYSDIAIGTARLFGFNLMRNFAYPYFSRDIAEFWRRWHISLTTWFRDYIYIPMGGSRGGTWDKIRNTFAVFIISGFWHGAGWTFGVWGMLNALYFIPLMLLGKNRNNLDIVAKGKLVPTVKELGQMALTFYITLIAWIFFRADSLIQAVNYIKGMYSLSFFTIPESAPFGTLVLVALLVSVEWIQRDKQHALEMHGSTLPRVARWAMYYGIIVVIFLFGGHQQSFIYFQF